MLCKFEWAWRLKSYGLSVEILSESILAMMLLGFLPDFSNWNRPLPGLDESFIILKAPASRDENVLLGWNSWPAAAFRFMITLCRTLQSWTQLFPNQDVVLCQYAFHSTVVENPQDCQKGGTDTDLPFLSEPWCFFGCPGTCSPSPLENLWCPLGI